MPKETHESSKEALRELTRILEETITAGADCLELERENQELVAYQYLGNTGIGAVAIPEKLQTAVVKEIVSRASLHRKPTGEVPAHAAGQGIRSVRQGVRQLWRSGLYAATEQGWEREQVNAMSCPMNYRI